MMTVDQQNAARLDAFDAILSDSLLASAAAAPFSVARACVFRPLFRSSFLLPPPEVEVEVEAYRGWPIVWETGYGFAASRGSDHVGWCDTVEEVRAEIDDAITERQRSYGSHYHDDTPSLDTSFHDHEMNCA